MNIISKAAELIVFKVVGTVIFVVVPFITIAVLLLWLMVYIL